MLSLIKRKLSKMFNRGASAEVMYAAELENAAYDNARVNELLRSIAAASIETSDKVHKAVNRIMCSILECPVKNSCPARDRMSRGDNRPDG